MADAAACGVRRVVRPQSRYRPSIAEQDEARLLLLAKMDAFYIDACERLAVMPEPVSLARFLDAGICVGLLDPVSNILTNAMCTSESDLRPNSKKVLFGSVVEENRADLGKRSLEGLVAFLVYFFPYLAKWEAVRYLLLADADLLAAACFIVEDRGMTRFSLTSTTATPAFDEALTLAAHIAKHSQPKKLAHVWMCISSRPQELLDLFFEAHSRRQDLINFNPVIPDLAAFWDFAASRLHASNHISRMSYQHTRSLQMVLLDTIHAFYLKALAMLPGGELRSRLHRSLLRAGNCYGPMDPVSNIILNTIWYDTNFPAAKTPFLYVIGPDSLTRLESRSLYGLVSFFQTCYNDLSEHQIVQYLIASFNEVSIDHQRSSKDCHRDQCMSGLYDEVIRKVRQQEPCANLQDAYAAAATASWHPNPKEQANFLASWNQESSLMFPVTSKDVDRLSSYLLSPQWHPIPERICKPSYLARIGKERSMYRQRRISRKVKAVLERHLQQDGEPSFDLHMICCVNENVCGPEYCEDYADPFSVAPYKYHYSHINFMATKRTSLVDSVPYPVLFFVEINNEKEDGEPLVLCQVNEPTPFAEHVRCIYCESAGARVIHPPLLNFHGGGSEFEKMIRGEHILSNDEHINNNEYCVKRYTSHGVDEDFMYVDVK